MNITNAGVFDRKTFLWSASFESNTTIGIFLNGRSERRPSGLSRVSQNIAPRWGAWTCWLRWL
jgi:hypothetical protein